MRSITASFVVLLALSPMAARAADCASAEDQATLNQCAAEDLKTADHALNAAFREIEKRLADDADGKHLLVKAQKAWIAFRDGECAFQSSAVEGGSAQPMVANACLAGLTEARTAQLKAYLACEEGDMSCPVPAAE